ncbi:hypothetical protein Pcinc_016979 [Petrolisthes cinctipes]|uniref:Paired domain-containing protein n=1 Tax=Petrolisthes cinctipes TaxID=88211 RepID=A0AAE1KQF0_PETCI|nr:hypothetical protein Pcinc_016979 [Petrolisthes cinctipes]
MNRQQQRLTLRGRIIGHLECGLSSRDIADRLGISRSTVQRWVQRWHESGDLRDHPRGRPPRVTTPEVERRILQASEDDPINNIAVQIRQMLNLEVSVHTVRLRLHAQGRYHRTPAQKQALTEEHRTNRLLFAEEYVDKEDLQFWGRMIFSDRKNI